MNKYLSGALAGFGATVPMTVAMFLIRDRLPWHEKHPLPPEQITARIGAQLGLQKPSNKSEHPVATWMVHFGFGAGAGALYGPVAEKVEGPPALKGAVFGLLVWGVSYLGWLPGAGILNQPKEQGARPTWMMIVAHVVWGVSLGVLSDLGRRK